MHSFLKKTPTAGWMSIVLQTQALTLAHVVRPAGDLPELVSLEVFALDGSPVAALQRLLSQRKLKRFSCTTLLESGACSVVQLDEPPVPLEERKEALRWQLKDVVNYPLDTACLDVLDIPNNGLPPGRSPGVLVVCAAETAVRACAAPFEAAGVPLRAIDVAELAQRNIAALLEDDNRGLAFLRVDESGLMLTLSFHGELVAVRRGEMTALQLSDENEEQRARVRERLTLEVQRSLDNFDRQYSHIPISRLVVASYPPAEGLVAELAENTYLPVVELDLSSVMRFPGAAQQADPQWQAKHLLSIGAALRQNEGTA